MTSQNTTNTCEYCGALLPERRLEVAGRAIFAGYELCQCPGAEAARKQAEEAKREQERQAQQRALTHKLAKVGIPARYVQATHPYAERMAKQVEEGQGFYIHGPNGTLKTTLAMAAALQLVADNVRVFAIPTYELMDSMRTRKDEDRDLFKRATTCDVLILDDLGKEASNTPYACERLFAIIDTRDRELRPIIITSNYKLSEIAKKITEGDIGRAIASRLSSSCKKVPLDGEDRRLNG